MERSEESPGQAGVLGGEGDAESKDETEIPRLTVYLPLLIPTSVFLFLIHSITLALSLSHTYTNPQSLRFFFFSFFFFEFVFPFVERGGVEGKRV